MPTYTQANSPLAITTPLGKDVLLLTGIRGSEAISQLFDFQLDLLAEVKSEVRFDDILGQNVTATMALPNGETRCFNGIVKCFSQGPRDETFTHFRAEVIPKLWLLTKKVQSRVFQHLTVPDILHQVLAGLDVTYEILATYYQRDFCVQYRESDFDFISRLMEEEGIYYFFKHSDGSHQMVVTDVPNQHPDVPGQSDVIYEPASGAVREDMRIASWEKTQELRSGEYTLWDHCFELPGNHLEVKEKTVESVAVGEVTHKLKVGGNDQLEIYEYPGGYAQRFDGIDKNGQPRPQDLQSIFRDNQRTVRVRMEQEDAVSLQIAGTSDCGHFLAGHKFKLQQHFDGDGEYLLTRIEHDAHLEGDSHNYQELKFKYSNRFTCIPMALPYRPQRVTNRPVIAGVQTATVVGPAGEEIFCDKYGRVKVQFHWDREGKKDANSSCWLRVAQVWAGSGWGAFFWPRVGHEVVVIFEEGDPDQPVIIGSVYNAENMPWFGLPANKMLAGFKSASVGGTAGKNFNGVVFNDHKGLEHVSIHSERNVSLNSENNKMIHSGRHKGERVAVAHVFTVGKLIPGGGSGGGNFDEGNPLPSPPPTGVLGLNSVMTFGANLQAAVPLNHQVALGNNLQICVNPVGLVSGVPGIPFPGIVAAVAGSGMGGNMQFTIGASGQVTLGQSFEISIGPPKIEIHQGYDDHLAVNILCGILGAAVIVFYIAYDVMCHTEDKGPYKNPQTDEEIAADQAVQNPSDKQRAALFLGYQILVSGLLMGIMGAETIYDHTDWFAGDTINALFDTKKTGSFGAWKPPEVTPPGVAPDLSGLAWAGAVGALAIIGAEIESTVG